MLRAIKAIAAFTIAATPCTGCGGDSKPGGTTVMVHESGAKHARDENHLSTGGAAGGASSGGSGNIASGGAPGGAMNGGGTFAVSGGANAGGPTTGSGGSAGGSTGGKSPEGTGGAAGTAAGGSAAEDPDAGHDGTDFSAMMGEYRAWHPQTDEPVGVSDYIFGLCRLPTLKEQMFTDSQHGMSRRLQDWANDAAVGGIEKRAAPFPEGAAIVKEKYVYATSGKLELVARGFMIKREPGFDPARGDWDYGYWEPDLGVLHTVEQSAYCGGCHTGGGATDSVFIDGLRP